MSLFPSEKDFDRSVAVNKKIAQAIHWSDLPSKVIYHVKSKERVETENGEETLLELVNRENDKINVRAPSSVMITLGDSYPKRKNLYIRFLDHQCNRKVLETVFLRDRQTSKRKKNGREVKAQSSQDFRRLLKLKRRFKH